MCEQYLFKDPQKGSNLISLVITWLFVAVFIGTSLPTFAAKWTYTEDSIDDSSGLSGEVSNTVFEIYAIAVKIDRDTVTVAINSRLPMGGVSDNGVQSSWGDFIFDFDGTQYGIRFDELNDTTVGSAALGLYKDVVTKSVSIDNLGHRNFNTYKKYIKRRGGTPTLGDIPIINNSYFGNTAKMPTTIDTGTKVDDDGFALLDATQLAAEGLDFAANTSVLASTNDPDNPYDYGSNPKPKNELGEYTYGFKFNWQNDMLGVFKTYIFTECACDSILMSSSIDDQTITAFTPPTTKTVGDADFTVSATGGASGNSVTFSIAVSSNGICSASGDNGETISIISNGDCIIKANQLGNNLYLDAVEVSKTVTIKVVQTIIFGALSNKTYGDANFVVSATGGASGNLVTFDTTGNCSNSGSTVTITDVGSCTVTASQAGNATYAVATDVPQTFTIAKKSDAPPPPPKPTYTPSSAPTGSTPVSKKGFSLLFAGDGSGYVTTHERSSGSFSCDSSSGGCQNPTLTVGWYKLVPEAAEGSKFLGWDGDCANGEFFTTTAGTCIASFELLPTLEEPVDDTPVVPTTPDVTQPPQPDTEPQDVTTPVVIPPVTEVNYVGFSEQAYTVKENAESVNITVNRTGIIGEISVDLATADDSAEAGIDYHSVDQTLFWANGDDTAITVSIAVIDNMEVDDDKNLTLSLGNAENAELGLDTVILTIVDDDEAPLVVQPEPIIPVTPEEPVIEPTQEESATEPTSVPPTDVIPIVSPTPPIMPDCKTSGLLNTSCNAGQKVITELEVDEHGHLAQGILDTHLTNKGRVSNQTITPNGSIDGGIVTGTTQNQGEMTNFVFVGASINGKNEAGEVVGTIGGKIVLASQIGGVIEDVNLAPNTQIVGTGTRLIGSDDNFDRIAGIINGDGDKPATLEKLHIKSKSRVSNVILMENITYGEDVTFTNVEFRTKVVQRVILKGHINGTRFKQTYTKVESVTIRSQSVISNLEIGDNVVFEDGITLGENVSFSVHESYMVSHGIDGLPNLTSLAATDTQGNSISTWARLQGGARFRANGSSVERYKKQVTFKRSKQKKVDILGNVLTDVRHISQKADILVVAAYTPPGATAPTFYMLDSNGTPVLWDMDISSLLPFQAQVKLIPVVLVQIWNNPLDILGDVQVYFGYRLLESRELVYSLDDVIEMKFTK